MLLISYDISNDKIRTKFAKYLSKFGFRLQYSVFEISNRLYLIYPKHVRRRVMDMPRMKKKKFS